MEGFDFNKFSCNRFFLEIVIKFFFFNKKIFYVIIFGLFLFFFRYNEDYSFIE